VAYKKGGRTLAIVTISRDLQSLQAEVAMEAEIRPQSFESRVLVSKALPLADRR